MVNTGHKTKYYKHNIRIANSGHEKQEYHETQEYEHGFTLVDSGHEIQDYHHDFRLANIYHET